MIRSTLLVVALVLGAWPLVGQSAPEKALVIRAGLVLPVAAAPIPGGSVLVVDGRIAVVGTKIDVPPGATVLEFPDGVLTPGFVDAAARVGLRRQRDETAAAWLPELRVEDGFDAADPVLDAMLAAGTTAVHVVPGDQGVVAGHSAVFRTRRRSAPLSAAAGFKLSLIEAALPRDRVPTSLLGAKELAAKGASEPAIVERIRAGGRLFVAAAARREIDVALDVAPAYATRPVLLTGAEALDRVAEIAGAAKGAVLVGIVPALEDAKRSVAARLVAAKVPVAFGSEAPDRSPEALRLAAIVSVLGGLDRAAALRALTLDAAHLLGIAERVGSVESGKDADLVVFSGDPTDPRSRVQLVLSQGRRAFAGKE